MNWKLPTLAVAFWIVVWPSLSWPALAADIKAKPSNYRNLLPKLKPGDTLKLAPGKYPPLAISNLNGEPDAWITIAGPTSGQPALIAGEAGSNTIEVVNSSFLAIQNLRIDSRGISGAFGISAKGGRRNLTHDIRIEGNTLVGQNADQQTDGISTKTPTWGWIIRNNQIIGAGTGIYLGNSDGTQPFVHGLIENNLIKNTIGYNMEIKDQISIPPVPGMPTEPASTIIRNNVFVKDDSPSPDGDRPNLLVGAFPNLGVGSLNLYEIYGNLFVHNPREALFQGSGRISLHDNIFVDGPHDYPAVVLTRQNFPLKLAYVYNNTVYTTQRGIYFGSQALDSDLVIGNLVFGSSPISGSITRQADNLTASVTGATDYVSSPSFQLGSMDFYPRPRKCQGPAIDLSPFQTHTAFNLDFNGISKSQSQGAIVFRGAYAGAGANRGWRLQAAIKPSPAATAAPPPSRTNSIDKSLSKAGRLDQVEIGSTTGTTGSAASAPCLDCEPSNRMDGCCPLPSNPDAASLLLWQSAARAEPAPAQ
jgi:hypothetical protein